MSLANAFNAAAGNTAPPVDRQALGRELVELASRPMDGSSQNINITQRVEALLNAGADLSVRDEKHGRTALIWAAHYCRARILGAILDRKPNLHARDNDGLSAMDHAVRGKNKVGINMMQKALDTERAELMAELGDMSSRRDFTPLRPANIKKRLRPSPAGREN